MKEQIYSMIGMYIRHSRIYSQNEMISDTVRYKQVGQNSWTAPLKYRMRIGTYERTKKE
ncbi:hypothetical protein KAW18_17185 [candidate division WOR-3 bacterium]|nr:hypothetical protein [candidate division WOR-3 bacterium]